MEHKLFSTPIYEFKFDSRSVELIQQEIKPVTSDLPVFNRPWPENVRSTFQFGKNNNIIDDYDMCYCKEKILEHAYNLIKKIPATFKLKIESSWINLLPPGGFQYSHHHPFSFLSGVYYISATVNSGSLIFENPNQILDYVDPIQSVFGENVFSIQPEIGKLVLFPSWLKHRVSINETEFDRAALVFNIVRF